MGWIKSGDRTLSGPEFNARALRAAGALESLGVRKGDGVALYLRNGLAYFEASFGVGMLGAYSIPTGITRRMRRSISCATAP
ncbi:AMP-binding protein [Camelimonas lactis]|uniref:AMP-binding enzyme n=1 Tax=Camelimonas lactis TaxID=659006 RepID=A0A4R2GRF4_9HYPH|nr:AMP-binding protein [Camelimonas lactis]TCO11753.1 AMP-binding enzyme [Camelimonas lactis]